jgi:membrane protease YdiL (CAAX protease family)
MINTLKGNNNSLSIGRIILFTMACIAIFVVIAVMCDMLTSRIAVRVIKVVLREVFLRMPLTIFSLHLFAKRVIKAYDPTAIYGKLSIVNMANWIIIGFALPIAIWLFYYLFHFAIPFQHTAGLLSVADKINLLIIWSAISTAAGITEEVIFRGHLYKIISNKYSKFKSMLITSFLFGLVHIFMLTSFSLTDILIVVFGGIIAGMMFSFIYQSTKVIWYAAIVHVIWDIFFIGKITTLASSQVDADKAIFAFKLTTPNLLLSGGNFGIEASAPCLVTYLVASVILYKRFYNYGNKIFL